MRTDAQAMESSLQWDAPAGCPQRADVQERLARMLGGSLDVMAERRVRVSARVRRRRPHGWVLDMTTYDPAGVHRRQITDDESCASLAEAAAVIIAIGVEEDPVTGSPSADAPLTDWGAFGEGSIGFGSLPGVEGIVRAGAALMRRRLRVELSAAYWPVRRSRTPERVDAGADLWLWTVSARGGAMFRVGALEIPITLGIEAGQRWAAGRGLEQASRSYDPWVAAVLTPALMFAPLRRLAFGVGVDAVVPLRRSPVVISGYGELYRPSPVTIRAGLRVEGRFGRG